MKEVRVELEVSEVERLTSQQLREIIDLSGTYQRIKSEIVDLEDEAKETKDAIKGRKEKLVEIADRITKLHLGEEDSQLDLFNGEEGDVVERTRAETVEEDEDSREREEEEKEEEETVSEALSEEIDGEDPVDFDEPWV